MPVFVLSQVKYMSAFQYNAVNYCSVILKCQVCSHVLWYLLFVF